ncbi:zinc finger MYM-type protein 1-like [Aphomia sociella]
MGLKLNETINKDNLKIINDETKKWRNILHRLLDVTLFLAQQNLAFRGHREDISSENRGNFLELVQLLAKYDPVLKEHCLKLEEAAGGSKRVPSYLSKGIQNEFIQCLGDHVRQKIIADIKKAKYYGIIFDSTPDESKIDQMSQIIRFVHIENDIVEVRESFLGFFLMSGKTAEDMSKDIQQQLEKYGLDIALCRAQGYDNAASMSGVHGGVQRKIREVNPKALFSPCSNHSLNLCGVHAFACVPFSVTCFGTVEKLYSFFSSSTQRWQLLKEKTGKKLKRLSDTRWSAHYESVKVVKENIETIVSSLEHFQDPTKANLDTRSGAILLLPAVCDFTFLTYIQFWLSILEEVNLVQQYLQSPKMTLDTGITKLNALNEYLVIERTTIVDNAVTFGIKKCNDMDINIEKRGRRKVKRTMPGESAHDAGLSIQEEIRRSMYECIDRFIQELSTRYGAMKQINNIFQIIETKFMLEASDDALAVAVDNLIQIYGEFDKEQVSQEIKRYRRHVKATDTSMDVAAKWRAQEILQFIIKWDFSESLPCISLILQYFLTICISVASCERSFSKLKLIKNYLRSTMGQERLVNLAVLSIERKISKEIDFTEVIEEFSKLKARKHI